MPAQLKKGPGKSRITYSDETGDFYISILASKSAEGEVSYDVLLNDLKTDALGKPVSLMQIQKIKRALADIPTPLDGPLVIR